MAEKKNGKKKKKKLPVIYTVNRKEIYCPDGTKCLMDLVGLEKFDLLKRKYGFFTEVPEKNDVFIHAFFDYQKEGLLSISNIRNVMEHALTGSMFVKNG